MSTAFTLISSLQETYEAKRKEFLADLQRKEEEMRQMFVNKVKEAEAELKEKEKEVRGWGKWRTDARGKKSLVVGFVSHLSLPPAP